MSDPDRENVGVFYQETGAIADWLAVTTWVAMVVIPAAGFVSYSKGHRWQAYAGLGSWVLGVLSFWIVELEGAANVIATLGLILVVFYSLRLARPASPWAKKRYRGPKYRRSVKRYGRLDRA